MPRLMIVNITIIASYYINFSANIANFIGSLYFFIIFNNIITSF